jgi:hypothetical protein
MPAKRSWNPILWVGFALVLVGFASYPFFFARFPITRDFPWANLALLALSVFLVCAGVVRAFRQPDVYRGKVSGSILGVLTVLLVGFFPASHGAPKVGEMAPDFTLPDSQGNLVTLSAMLDSSFAPNGSTSATAGTGSAQTAGTVLIFYRGYW